MVRNASLQDDRSRRGVGREHIVRTLPIRVKPLPEESFDSWLEALAHRTDATWGDILGAVGIVGMRGSTASYRATRAAVSLTPEQADTISYCTGVDPRRLREMTLQPWIKDPSWQRRSVASMRISGSRFCPRCLDERGGRWRVWWRLRWAFACPTHGCLLAHACSVCGGPQRTAPPRVNDVPSLGSCTRTIVRFGEPRKCNEQLSNMRAVHLDTDPAVVVQQEVLRVLRAGHTSGGIYALSPVASTVFARDLQTLGSWMLNCAQATDVTCRISHVLWEQCRLQTTKEIAQQLITSGGARVTYSTPATDAAIACMAMPILQATDSETAAKSLQWLTSSMRRRGVSPSRQRACWRQGCSPSLDALRRVVLSPRSFRRSPQM
ncbi:TniQ family protein [Mycobacterium sp. MUNTM1]